MPAIPIVIADNGGGRARCCQHQTACGSQDGLRNCFHETSCFRFPNNSPSRCRFPGKMRASKKACGFPKPAQSAPRSVIRDNPYASPVDYSRCDGEVRVGVLAFGMGAGTLANTQEMLVIRE
jgi:hypothetical protein